MKAFLCLALPESHPFWSAAELDAEPRSDDQPHCGMHLARDETQVVALSGGHDSHSYLDQGAAKYARLAYSSRFGPTLETTLWGNAFAGDSVLVLTEPGAPVRIRRDLRDHAVIDGRVYSCWSPCDGVVVHTVLAGGAPWHVRLHRVVTDRPLVCEESGFAAGDWDVLRGGMESGDGHARVVAAEGLSILHDLGGGRTAAAQPLPPNASLTRPYAAVPVLRCRLEPGTHDLACAVFASDRVEHPEAQRPPGIPAEARSLLETRAPR